MTDLQNMSGEIAVETFPTAEIASEVVTQFSVKDITILGLYTQISFFILPNASNGILILPDAYSITATQKGRQLKQTTHKGKCEVFKGDEVHRGNLISKSTTLNNDTSFILISQQKGINVKIMQPDKIISYPDTTHILADVAGPNVEIAMMLENVLLSEFQHNITRKEDGFYLEQAVLIENISPYKFISSGAVRICVSKHNSECGDGKIDNVVLELKTVGTLAPSSKEKIIYSHMKMEDPCYYSIVSTVKHDITRTIHEFILPDNIYPGSITQYLPNGDISSMTWTSYVSKGDKILLHQIISDNIQVNNVVSNDKEFVLVVTNTSFTEVNIKLQEVEYITSVKINGTSIDNAKTTFVIPVGDTTIWGTYASIALT
jgi:hypothetical protein